MTLKEISKLHKRIVTTRETADACAASIGYRPERDLRADIEAAEMLVKAGRRLQRIANGLGQSLDTLLGMAETEQGFALWILSNGIELGGEASSDDDEGDADV